MTDPETCPSGDEKRDKAFGVEQDRSRKNKKKAERRFRDDALQR
jgi:hypothetical protein